MNRTPVSSSQIKSVGYDAATETLEIEFAQGNKAVYQYSKVSPEIHTALMGEGVAGHSVGSYFIRNIKKRPDLYPYKKVEDAAARQN